MRPLEAVQSKDRCCSWHNFSAGIEGMGPEAPTYENEHGGKQSDIGYRFDLVDQLAMFVMARILAKGAKKYGEDNWRSISERENANHAIAHLTAYLAGDKGDDHLGDAFCRVMFTLAVHLQGGPDPMYAREAAQAMNTAGTNAKPLDPNKVYKDGESFTWPSTPEQGAGVQVAKEHVRARIIGGEPAMGSTKHLGETDETKPVSQSQGCASFID